jgi:hypothetical protein
LGAGEDGDDVTTEIGGPARTEEGPAGGTTTDTAAKAGTGDEAEGPARAVGGGSGSEPAGTVGDSEDALNGTMAPASALVRALRQLLERLYSDCRSCNGFLVMSVINWLGSSLCAWVLYAADSQTAPTCCSVCPMFP